MNIFKKFFRRIYRLDDIEDNSQLEVDLLRQMINYNNLFSKNLPVFICLFGLLYSIWLPWWLLLAWVLPILGILFRIYKVSDSFLEVYNRSEVTKELVRRTTLEIIIARSVYMLIFSSMCIAIVLAGDERLYILPIAMVASSMAMMVAVTAPYPKIMVTVSFFMCLPLLYATILVYDGAFYQALGAGIFLYYLMLMKLGFSLYGSAKETIEQRHALAVARDEAEEASKSKSNFLATMSHEVRTPLNGILGMANLLRDTRLDGKQASYLDTIRYSGETLLTMLNDILDYSKMEAGKFEIEKIDFDLNKLVKSVADIMRSRAEEKSVRVKVDFEITVPEYINCDPTRLRQVLLNLLSNGIKFTDKGIVTINVKNVHEEGQEAVLRFEVVDTGIGIPESAKQKLFKEFTQVDSSTSRKYGGTGLGLSICQQIVGLLDGTIGVDSVEGEGSTFWFEVPVGVVDYYEYAFNAEEEEQKTPVLETLQILLVDDNEINLQVGHDILKKYGHDIFMARNGQEAIDAAKEAAFDVILMDMQMPVMNGLEAAKAITNLPGAASQAPIIALTANSMAENADECVAAGMVDHVSKPFDPADLIRTIARHCPDKVQGDSKKIELGKTKFSDSYEEDGKSVDLSALNDLEEMFDRDYVLNFLQTHMADVDRFVSALETESDGGDIEVVHHSAHELKSISAMFGLAKLSNLAEGIERCCVEGREEEARKLSKQARDHFVSNLDALQAFYPVALDDGAAGAAKAQ